MELAKKLTTIIHDKENRPKLLLGAFLILGLISLLLPTDKPQKESIPSEKVESVDTFIPAGHVLVPIELANASSLGSLLSETGGIVDLYLPNGKTSLKVASKLKILKAPYNPDLYAVLVREQESGKILSYAGPFVAVVQNPDERGKNLIESSSRKISIDYQN